MRKNGWASVEVKPEVQTAYNAVLQNKHTGAVWKSGCRSWYLDARGRNTTLWPGFTFVFRRQTASFDAQAYVIEKVAEHRDSRASVGPRRSHGSEMIGSIG
jgi:cyclohexanone monooxygenase